VYIYNGKMREREKSHSRLNGSGGDFGLAERGRAHGRTGSQSSWPAIRARHGDSAMSTGPRARQRGRANDVGRLIGRGEPVGVGENPTADEVQRRFSAVVPVLQDRGGGLVKGKCALGPFLCILVIECQHMCLIGNLCTWMNKVKIMK
jgi:hypothetical protein